MVAPKKKAKKSVSKKARSQALESILAKRFGAGAQAKKQAPKGKASLPQLRR